MLLIYEGILTSAQEAKALVPHIPKGGILLFDRGYPSYDLIDYLIRHYQGYWVFRCPARSTFTAVEDFVQSGKTEAAITLAPPGAKPITLRAIRMESPDGGLSVLLTNLPDEPRFAAAAVISKKPINKWQVDKAKRIADA